MAVLGSFLDMDKVKDICDAHGYVFEDKIAVTPFKAARIYGRVKDHIQLTTSAYEARRKDRSSRPRANEAVYQYLSGYNEDILQGKGQKLDDKLVEIQAKKKDLQTKKREADKAYYEAKKADAEKNNRDHSQLKECRANRAEAVTAINRCERELKDVRSGSRLIKGYLSQMDSSKEKEQKTPPVVTSPSLERPYCEDKTDFLDISTLKKEAADRKRHLTFSGTDYGLCTLSTTVPLTMDMFLHHIESYNKFSILEAENETDTGAEGSKIQEEEHMDVEEPEGEVSQIYLEGSRHLKYHISWDNKMQ